jgi:hypothetical protein
MASSSRASALSLPHLSYLTPAILKALTSTTGDEATRAKHALDLHFSQRQEEYVALDGNGQNSRGDDAPTCALARRTSHADG